MIKYDLVIITPNIAINSEKWENGKYVDDPLTITEAEFEGCRILSYKKIKQSNDPSLTRIKEELQKFESKLIDRDGETISDFAVLIQQGLDYLPYNWTSPTALVLFQFFCYFQYLDGWTVPEIIKIKVFEKGGDEVFIHNFQHVWSSTSKHLYTLPKKQKEIADLKMRKEVELQFLQIFSEMEPELKNRLLNSLNLFNESRRISRSNPNGSIVMVCSAFEALLDISDEGGKTKIFSYALKLLWGFNERIAKWATELYQIRSQIVHGAVVGDEKLLASQDRHYPHLEIARRVFIDSLQFILESLGFIVLRVGYKTEAIWEIQNLVMSNKEKIRSFLSNKSNWTYKTFKANIEIFEDFIQLIESYTLGDVSAQNKTRELTLLICEIAEEWIEDNLERLKSTSNPDSKDYVKFALLKYDEIKQFIASYKAMDWPPVDHLVHLDFLKSSNEFFENVRILGPTGQKGDEPGFRLPEFLYRSLRAIDPF